MSHSLTLKEGTWKTGKCSLQWGTKKVREEFESWNFCSWNNNKKSRDGYKIACSWHCLIGLFIFLSLKLSLVTPTDKSQSEPWPNSFRLDLPTSCSALQMLLLCEKWGLKKPGSPFLLGWTQTSRYGKSLLSTMNNMLKWGVGPALFVLVEQTAMEPNAIISAGNSSKCDYTLKLFNKRRLFS